MSRVLGEYLKTLEMSQGGPCSIMHAPGGVSVAAGVPGGTHQSCPRGVQTDLCHLSRGCMRSV